MAKCAHADPAHVHGPTRTCHNRPTPQDARVCIKARARVHAHVSSWMLAIVFGCHREKPKYVRGRVFAKPFPKHGLREMPLGSARGHKHPCVCLVAVWLCVSVCLCVWPPFPLQLYDFSRTRECVLTVYFPIFFTLSRTHCLFPHMKTRQLNKQKQTRTTKNPILGKPPQGNVMRRAVQPTLRFLSPVYQR